MLGFTAEEISNIGLTWGLGGLIVFMLFIIYDLARKSNAGRFGTFILFFVLAFGIFGFLLKHLIGWLMDI